MFLRINTQDQATNCARLGINYSYRGYTIKFTDGALICIAISLTDRLIGSLERAFQTTIHTTPNTARDLVWALKLLLRIF